MAIKTETERSPHHPPAENTGSATASPQPAGTQEERTLLAESEERALESYLPTQTAEQQAMMRTAEQRVLEAGAHDVLKELSVAHTFINADLLPYLAIAAFDKLDQPLTVSTPKFGAQPTALKEDVLQTACSSLDKLLNGGFPTDAPAIFEVSGAASSGKTQLMIQLSLMCAAPKRVGGLSGPVIYTVTEGKPPMRRLISLSESLSRRLRLTVEESNLPTRILIEEQGNSDSLLYWATFRLPWLLRQKGARLIIIDSIAALYRAEFSDPVMRANHLVQFVRALRVAMAPTRAFCICVNQVSQAVDPFSGSLDAVVPALGAPWSQVVTTRLFLKRTFADERVVTVRHSSYLPNDGRLARFRVTTDGIISVEDET